MPALQLVFEDNDGSIALLEPKCIVEDFEVESDQDPVGLTFLDSAGLEFIDEAFT